MQPDQTNRPTVTLDLDRAGRTHQVSITLHEAGRMAEGYRLLGPKYTGNSEPVATRTLDARDIAEIRAYLDHVDGGDKAAELRGFDRAVALLRDAAGRRAWFDLPANRLYTTVHDHEADKLVEFLEDHREVTDDAAC